MFWLRIKKLSWNCLHYFLIPGDLLLVGVPETDCLTEVHRQENRLSGCYVAVGRETRHSPSGHKLVKKVSIKTVIKIIFLQ